MLITDLLLKYFQKKILLFSQKSVQKKVCRTLKQGIGAPSFLLQMTVFTFILKMMTGVLVEE